MLKRQLPFFIFASLVVSLLLGVTEIEAADGESAEALFLKGDYQECLCLLYTSPSPRDLSTSRMPSSA